MSGNKAKLELENWLSVEWALTCFLADIHSSLLYSLLFSGLGGINFIPIAQASKLAPCPVPMICLGLGKFKSVRCGEMFSGKTGNGKYLSFTGSEVCYFGNHFSYHKVKAQIFQRKLGQV